MKQPLQNIFIYNQPIKFCVTSLATLCHVVQHRWTGINKVTIKMFDFFTLRLIGFFPIQVLQIMLENYKLVNYKQQ